MSDPLPFPLNAWYAVAWETEVLREPFARRICDIPMVFYRKNDRSLVALRDSCWHRLVPLSEGRVVGDNLMCGYHGLVFNGEGRCVHMPSQETINPSAAVRSFPVVEKHGMVWVWPGDRELADPANIADLHWFDDPEWAAARSYNLTRCDYRLLVDNLMDLTHETFLHGGTIGQEDVAEAPFEMTHGEGRVRMTRMMEGIDAPPFFAMQHRMAYGYAPTAKVKRWQISDFTAPGTIAIDVGIAVPEDAGVAGAGNRIDGWALHTVTPASRDSCHYFAGYARRFAIDRRDITEELGRLVGRILLDDYRMVERQQNAMSEADRDPIYHLNIDSGALWARRVIAGLVARESDPAPTRLQEEAAE